MPALQHVAATTPPDEIADRLRTDGYVIVDDLAPAGLMDTISDELAPHVAATPLGYNAMIGQRTRRTGALIARSPACRTLVQDPTVLGVCGDFLGHASAFQLMLTQVISIEPGESAQALHRDQNAFDFYPFPDDYHVQCNTLWALSDYTAEMGATRVVPGSQSGGKKPTDYSDADCLQAEMSRGSVLIYTGKIVHSGGANRSQQVRRAINVNYCVGWVRQEENQFLSVPPEVARTLDDDLLRLIGYQEGAWAMGYFRDFEDPLRALRGDAIGYGFDGSRLAGDAGAAFTDQLTHSE
ncbi:phytanoyl-CoA dioxygenase PhyH [Mycobacterium sp. BK558]|uniref:Phytanoyl-CoA dioxygenase (PhyH) n=1 Tax=Mycolicibacterium chlorophenolicum TaxID=37916 RepID=A0A0J6VEM8_9MYCO|nr:phytanoyl-CoA dioxygenase family protein [Mycolicibacterium chlorophenolicum]KMO68674.1 Phytanoyl-CoA dioxygenase (PhyH) [Mycolicibacterium chlorophenolicum]RZT12160.1 phytanoyl-CoA dioxygenase PhyH [Mycobacterium sp. BK558]